MIEKIDAKSFLDDCDWPIIDVRSPAEYEYAHIPGSFNIPLLENDERAEVGILYKKSGRQDAILRGLEIIGPKMAGFVKAGFRISPKRQLRIHCWRGGMRSDSMAWLFSTAMFEVKTMIGGYKTYRRYIREQLNTDVKYVVLGGKTGSGKTEILHELSNLGCQVIDLEGMAHHKGSSFGALGELPQPSSEQFENDFFEIWKTMDHTRPIWLEDESHFIGKVSIPEPVFEKMRTCHVIRVDMPLELRVERLVKDYANYPKQGLIEATQRITKRLGGQHAKNAIEAIEQGDFKTAIEIVLFYYDKTYNFGLSRRSSEKIFTVEIDTINAGINAEKIKDLMQTLSF
ncbi:MAG: tRNA 2-selenouridine(34) synthase MnmH [Bacteroidales bacterium]|nr:tRNA 2-selenouridine(34) synthase MnmH [Bacteroidales bacterium]